MQTSKSNFTKKKQKPMRKIINQQQKKKIEAKKFKKIIIIKSPDDKIGQTKYQLDKFYNTRRTNILEYLMSQKSLKFTSANTSLKLKMTHLIEGNWPLQIIKVNISTI